MAEYRIFTDATADMSRCMLEEFPELEIIPMSVDIGRKSYSYGPAGNITAREFYNIQRHGNFASTSQINPAAYLNCFEPWLRRGVDVMYLGFSSGMSGTMQTAQMCVNQLTEKYPERKIVAIDTLCASVGEGFLVYEAAKKQNEGLDFEQLCSWVLENRLKVCHWFTVDSFENLKHGGRVSAAAAAAGTALGIKPLLYVDNSGSLVVAEKPRGRKRAIEAQLKRMEKGWVPENGNFVLIGQGDCPEEALLLQQHILRRFPEADVRIADIGPVIGSHTGPGMLAVIYWGSHR